MRQTEAYRKGAKQNRIARRLFRKEISKVTYARKQFLLRARAQHGMAQWFRNRGVTTQLETHPELRVGTDDKEFEESENIGMGDDQIYDEKYNLADNSDSQGNIRKEIRQGQTFKTKRKNRRHHSTKTKHEHKQGTIRTPHNRSIAGMKGPMPEHVEEWVHVFMTNERCEQEKRAIRGIELMFTMLEKGRHTEVQEKGYLDVRAARKPLLSSVLMHEVWYVFGRMDVNRNGKVTPKEFKKAMHKLGETFSDMEVRKVFDYVDVNNSGVIGIAELQAAMAVYQKKYLETEAREQSFGKAKNVMQRIYAKRMGINKQDTTMPGFERQ